MREPFRVLTFFMQDLRYAWRIARQNLGSTLAAVLALSLAIAATTTIFSIFYGVILRPLPFTEPNRVVALFNTHGPDQRMGISLPDYLDWRRELISFRNLGIYFQSQVNLVANGSAANLYLLECDAPFFDVFGIPMGRGRNFISSEDEPGRQFETILSWSTWQDHFGGSEDILKQKVLLDGKPYAVVGVLPKDFTPIGRAQALVPVSYDPNYMGNRRGYHLYRAWARLRPGISIEQANAELAIVSRSLAQRFPHEDKGLGTVAVDLRETMTGRVRLALLSLFGTVCCVLLMACGNVAGLLMARSSARQREMAVRVAIGASRLRLIRQLLTESVFLSMLAGLLGLGLAAIAIRFIGHLEYANIPHSRGILFDWRAVAFTVSSAFLTGIFFGLAPVIQVSAQSVNTGLKQSSGRSTESKTQRHFRQTLIVVQAAFASTLLIGSGLLIHSFAELSRLHLGFDPQHVLTLNFSLSTDRYSADGAMTSFVDQVLEKLRSLPGVEDAAFANNLPLHRVRTGGPIDIEGRPAPVHMAEAPDVLRSRVTPTYFSLMRIPLVRGRMFNAQDRLDGVPVVIINQTLAHTLFQGQDPIGKRLRYAERPVWKQVVGVVGDVPQEKLEVPTLPETFVPYAQEADFWTTLAVRVKGDPLSYLSSVRTQIQGVDPFIASFGPRLTMDQQLADAIGWRTFITSSLTAFSLVAIFLAAIGIYSTIAYSVTLRVGEIGLRLALGAAKADIIRMIVRQGTAPALVGTFIGLLLALGSSRALASLLYGVRSSDLLTYLLVAVFLSAVALLASYVPAARAASIDPNVALREE